MAYSGSSTSSILRLYRHLCRELRAVHKKEKFKESPAFLYMSDQFRNHQVTSEKYCRGKTEAQYIGETYLCLIQSVKKHQELYEQYAGSGERTVEESAGLVGLKLPDNGTHDT